MAPANIFTVCQLNSFVIVISKEREEIFEDCGVMNKKKHTSFAPKWGTLHCYSFISKEIVSPMTMGFLNPCIFLPAGEIDKETLCQFSAHELTHIYHKDFNKQMMLVISSLYHCLGTKQLLQN